MDEGRRGGRGGSGVNIPTCPRFPYYPGRDDLWIGGGLAQAQVDETQFVHPIAEGAEAYYTYQSGDSVLMTLPDGKKLTLRELKIEARWPKWNLSVGSFWFDEVQRASRPGGVPDFAADGRVDRGEGREQDPPDTTARRETARTLRTGAPLMSVPPTGAAAVGAAPGRRNSDDNPPPLAKALLSPLKVDISAITMEYGLYNQRFWLTAHAGARRRGAGELHAGAR